MGRRRICGVVGDIVTACRLGERKGLSGLRMECNGDRLKSLTIQITKLSIFEASEE